jgi:hypothetical protein
MYANNKPNDNASARSVKEVYLGKFRRSYLVRQMLLFIYRYLFTCMFVFFGTSRLSLGLTCSCVVRVCSRRRDCIRCRAILLTSYFYSNHSVQRLGLQSVNQSVRVSYGSTPTAGSTSHADLNEDYCLILLTVYCRYFDFCYAAGQC